MGLLGCLGLLVSRIQWRWPRRIAIVLLVGLSLYQTLSFREKLDVPGRPGLRAVCEQIRAADDETRLVVVRSSYLFHAAKFYLPNYQVRMLLEDGWPPDYFGGGIMTDADFVSEDTLRSASAFWQLSQRNPDRFQRIANVQRVSPVYSARLVGRFSSAGLVYAARFRPQPPQRN